MQCPCCHRIKSTSAAFCSGCGYGLTGGSTLEEGVDVQTDRVPVGPMLDFELRRPILDRTSQMGGRHRASGRPIGSSRSRPLSVRRTTPDVPKFWSRASRLPLRSSLAPKQPSGGVVQQPPVAIQSMDKPVSLLGRRLAAGLLDFVILASVNSVVGYFTLRLVHLSFTEIDQLPVLPLSCFLLLFDVTYFVFLTAFGGQTIGKIAVGLRVEKRRGQGVSILSALTRTVGYGISVVPVGLGFLRLFFRRGRALHDLLADTRVVRVP